METVKTVNRIGRTEMREHISRKDALELLKKYNKEPFHI